MPDGSSPIAVVPRLLVQERGWRRYVPHLETRVWRTLNTALDAVPEVSVETLVLTTDRLVQILNWRDRGRNKPTNVLTYEPRHAGAGGHILLALGVVRREALAEGRSVADHLAHLIVHGVLHLAGEDHHHPGDAMRMEMAEARILHRLGVPNPWKGR